MAGPQGAGLESSPLAAVRDSGPERLERRAGGGGRFASGPLLPESGWVGSAAGLAAGEAAHSPAPALAPNNAASPSPSPLSGRLLGSRREGPPPPLPPRQPAAATGPLRGSWTDGVGARSGPAPWAWGHSGPSSGMQGARPENLHPNTHTHTRARGTRAHGDGEADAAPSSSVLEALRGPEMAPGRGGRVVPTTPERVPAEPAAGRPRWGRGQLSEDASVAPGRRRRLYF